MFFQYLGDKPLDVKLPGEQHVITVYPSKNGQRTSYEPFYEHIFSEGFVHRDLFIPADDYIIPEIKKKADEDHQAPKAQDKQAKVKIDKVEEN